MTDDDATQLQLAGTSFQATLDDVRRDLAMRYLDDPRTSLDEVGFLLGFAEPSVEGDGA